jgi:hypothetical protein
VGGAYQSSLSVPLIMQADPDGSSNIAMGRLLYGANIFVAALESLLLGVK